MGLVNHFFLFLFTVCQLFGSWGCRSMLDVDVCAQGHKHVAAFVITAVSIASVDTEHVFTPGVSEL